VPTVASHPLRLSVARSRS